MVARHRGRRVDDQVEPTEVALGARERLGDERVVAGVAAHDRHLGVRLAQAVEGGVGAGDRKRPPAGRQALGDDRAADVARPEGHEDRWSGHAGSLPAVGAAPRE